MRAAVITAIILGLAAPAAVAANASEPTKGATKATEAKAAHKPEHRAKPTEAKHEHNRFVNAGTVTAVDTTAGTITFTVRGGREKSLRGKSLTVVVTASTKIRRHDADAKLVDVIVGDHVNVKGTKKDGVYTATRVSASKAKADTETENKPETNKN